MKNTDTKQYIILADVPPIPSKDRLEKYQEAGFTYYNLTEDYVVRDNKNGGITKEYMDVIDRCHDMGLKVVLRTMRANSPDYYDGITTEFKDKVDGYYYADEPAYRRVDWYGSPEIDRLIKNVDYHNKYGQGIFHINLLQSYGMKLVHGKNPPEYRKYIDEYIEKIFSKVKGIKSLSTDHYPMAFDDKQNHIKATSLYDYFLIADRTKKLRAEGHQVITGICIQLTSDKGLFIREIECQADIDFQLGYAVAFGAELLEYYLYVGRNTGIITDKVEQTSYSKTYDYVKNANARLKIVGEELLNYKWNKTKTVVGTEYNGAHNDEAYELVKEFNAPVIDGIKDFSSTADALLSEFINDEGKAYLALNFTEPTADIDNTVAFEFEEDKELLIIKGGVKEKVNTKDAKYTTVLKSGEYIFVKEIK